MSKVYVCADLHLRHEKVVKFRPWKTVEKHDRELIARWNSVCRKRDTIWVLGDVCLGSEEDLALLSQMLGSKRLVMGNHDMFNMIYYLPYFLKVYGAYEYGDAILTHMPVHENQFPRYRVNVHGHMHSKNLHDPRWKCVSMEQINYTPILLTEAVK